MKKIKWALWAVVLGFIVLFIYQNQELIMEPKILRIDLPFVEELHTPELPIAILFIACFLTGFLLSYGLSFAKHFRSKRTIKKLNAAVDSQVEELSVLKNELELLQSGPPESFESKEEKEEKEQS